MNFHMSHDITKNKLKKEKKKHRKPIKQTKPMGYSKSSFKREGYSNGIFRKQEKSQTT